MTENAIAKEIVDAAYHLHVRLGPGLLESAYETILEYELGKRGLGVVRQPVVAVNYDSITVESAFRADLIVEGKVIVEVKSLETVLPVHKKQLTTYLKLTGLHLGLLINFNVVLLKNGITRLVNGLDE